MIDLHYSRDTAALFREALLEESREELARALFNERYNAFCRRWADTEDGEKRIPYMGWFWRDVDFWSRRIPLGFGQSLVAFMEKNKWDHYSRLATVEEVEAIMAALDEAMACSLQGGVVTEAIEATNRALKRLWDWMQELPMSPGA